MRSFLLTCEHASCAVPSWLCDSFKVPKDVLNSHRGWDPGAFAVYQELASRLHPGFMAAGDCTRLAIELNRSAHHPSLFSSWARILPSVLQDRLRNEVWQPFRSSTLQYAQQILKQRNTIVLHLSVHSFTPILNSVVRNAEIGLLYDPTRPAEKEVALRWQSTLREMRPDLYIRRNYPYQGKADGHVTNLRKVLGPRYLGFEIELKQDWLSRTTPAEVADLLYKSLP